MDRAFLHAIRGHELTQALAAFSRYAGEAQEILEVGAGPGWQARRIADAGHVVRAIDVPQTGYADECFWPVHDYDGKTIPYPDGRFGLAFTSSTLEHIAHLDAFERELLRVLRPGGVAVHVLPSASWRLASTLTHVPVAVRELARDGAASWRDAARRLVPPRHGEWGTATTELWTFSRFWWRRHFRRAGWDIEAYDTNRLAYTGNMLLGAAVPLPVRRALARVLGSACHVFVLRPRPDAQRACQLGAPVPTVDDAPVPSWDVETLRDAREFARLPADAPVFVYGAGRGGRIVRAAIERAGRRVATFVTTTGGGELDGLPVLSVGQLATRWRDEPVVIASTYVKPISIALARHGITRFWNAFPYAATQ